MSPTRRVLTIGTLAVILVLTVMTVICSIGLLSSKDNIQNAGVIATEVSTDVDLKTPYFINLDTVVRVVCATLPDGVTDIDKLTADQAAKVTFTAGTGTIIAHNRVLTANHVIEGTTLCAVNKRLATIAYDSYTHDVAVLDVNLGTTAVSNINCDGFVKGDTYMMYGFALGRDFAMDVGTFSGVYQDLDVPTDNKGGIRKFPHLGLFGGGITPGMSGGPVFDFGGHVVGINNISGANFSGLRQLADTELCTALKAAPTAR